MANKLKPDGFILPNDSYSLHEKNSSENSYDCESKTITTTYLSRDEASHEEKIIHSRPSNISTIPLFFIKCTVALYSLLTLPFYFVMQRPWKAWKAKRTIWSKRVVEEDFFSHYVGLGKKTDPVNGAKTMDELFRASVDRFGDRKFCGQRQIIAEADFYSGNGKVTKKYQLGEYKWLTYSEIMARVENFCRGLLELGCQPKKPVLIFAETRHEWMIVLQACFRLNIPVATLFSNIGEDGLIHTINETEASCIFTSQDCLPKLKKIVKNIPLITHVIYMEGLRPADTDFPKNIRILPFKTIEKSDYTLIADTRPTPEDIALIMYTSGSTGIPKGVIMSHSNLISITSNCINGVPSFRSGDVYIAYLPMAHAFELSSEFFLTALGSAIGYSSPFTLTDKSTGVMDGCKGDASVLRPDIMCIVPLMLDRIRKSVLDIVSQKSGFAQSFFHYALKYKTCWHNRGFSTPILNRLLFKKMKNLLGGKVRAMVGGGAPLSADTHTFIQMIMDTPVIVGYGMTESCAGITIMTPKDRSTGRVGAPFGTGCIRLVDWPEGYYFVRDKPNPRGEIVIGGDTVSKGYFKNEELTKECFVTSNGMRWVYTGDIGEIFPDGTLKIIDRKKDLVKLQNGEYISLGKVETELKTCSLVDNVCIVGNSFRDYIVGLVSPNVDQLKMIANKLDRAYLSISELCKDAEVTDVVYSIIKCHGLKSKLQKSEIPKKIKLCPEEWIPETGFVAATLKIRRKYIEEFYRSLIEDMYHTNTNGNLNGFKI